MIGWWGTTGKRLIFGFLNDWETQGCWGNANGHLGNIKDVKKNFEKKYGDVKDLFLGLMRGC